MISFTNYAPKKLTTYCQLCCTKNATHSVAKTHEKELHFALSQLKNSLSAAINLEKCHTSDTK